MSRPGRVLSIQSHVVHGHVGNKSAVFPMQLLGLDVEEPEKVDLCRREVRGAPGAQWILRTLYRPRVPSDSMLVRFWAARAGCAPKNFSKNFSSNHF